MLIWAWLGAAAVGLSLGLLGAGGAILTVPILVYLVGHSEKSAITESLAIVGAIAIVGVLRAAMQKRIDFRSALLLAIPGIFGTYLGANIAKYLPGAVQLTLLAGLMIGASVLMFRGGGRKSSEPQTVGKTPSESGSSSRWSLFVIVAQGVGLGLTTGLVGVGGGFLIIPVLVLLRRLPMPVAVGTSLAIIAVNSTTGFLSYLAAVAEASAASMQVDWSTIGTFAAVGIVGNLVGSSLGERIPQATLRRAFAVFLVVMAAYILVRQAPRVLMPMIESDRTETRNQTS